MDDIKEIYYGDVYAPFLQYCELHQYTKMSDLAKIPFDRLHELLHITPMLASRIKTVCFAYYKKHPECLQSVKRNQKRAQPEGNVQELEERLKLFFSQNADRLIHLSEITKVLEKRVKRDAVLHVLEQAEWCKIVDKNTFFYVPSAEGD